MSEAAKYKHLFVNYCHREDGEPGCGVDLGSQGYCTIPWAIQLDLPPSEFAAYCGGAPQHGPIALRGNAKHLPFDAGSLDFVLASHVLEDFPQTQWPAIFTEWKRVLKPGGRLIILVPEVERWNYAIRVLHQPPNCAHSAPEPSVGDMSRVAMQIGLEVVEERLTECYPGDYTILGCFRVPK